MSEPVTCPKCGYTRSERDQAPEWQCPACQIAYVKAGAAATGVAPPVARAEPEAQTGPNLRVWLLLVLLAVVAVYHHHERERAAQAERTSAPTRAVKPSAAQPAPPAASAVPAVAPSAPQTAPPEPPRPRPR